MVQPLLLIAVLIVSVVIHENAHGWVALALGDQTAKSAGRLTLNPIKHLDPVGSLIMPAFLAFTAGMAFGYAKPVPINPRALRGGDRGFAIVALAGPASNVALAFVSLIVLRAMGGGLHQSGMSSVSFTARILIIGVFLNIWLAAFNLLPIPPLDGSRLLRLFLRPGGIQMLDRVEPFGFLILLGMLALLPEPLFRVVGIIADALTRLLPA